MNLTLKVFLSLLQSGLWEKNVQIDSFDSVKYQDIYRLSEEQSVVGIIAAGIGRVRNVKIPQEISLKFIGATLQLEARNKAMNFFIASLVEKMCEKDIYTILVKGQGIAQCYEKPLWRASGDVDLLLNSDDYITAQRYFDAVASSFKEGSKKDLINSHREYNINDWQVELHGTLNSNLSRRVDRIVDSLKYNVFNGGEVRIWQNNNTPVYLPSPDNDVIFIFTHILQHFFDGGIGLRQICDWCRLLWTYRDTLNCNLLESRIKKMGLLSEWTAFASLAVVYMGMPVEAMPLYKKGCERKAERILSYIIKSGNFGHNRDFSYTKRHSTLVRKAITLWRQAKDSCQLALIFPIDAPKFLVRYIYDGINSLLHKKSIINL